MPAFPKIVAVLLSLVLWLFPATAHAAEDLSAANLLLDQPVKPIVGLDPSNIPSEKVNQFVNACLKVVALIDQREGELRSAETDSESQRIEQEIEAAAMGIIEQEGLTRQEYIQLLSLANTDPEFGERIAILLQEATS